jgi:hypothetical protein
MPEGDKSNHNTAFFLSILDSLLIIDKLTANSATGSFNLPVSLSMEKFGMV